MKSKKKKTNFTIHSKLMKNIFLILTIISFSFVLILSSGTSLVFDKKPYFNEQEKTGVYNDLNKSLAQNVTNELINYFRYKEVLDTDFFNQQEKEHMQDVKSLINKLTIAYYISIVLMVLFFILYYNTTKDFSRSLSSVLIFGSLITISLFILLYFVNFSFLFNIFHISLFESNYLFPANSNIIKLFPESFFSGMFFLILKVAFIKTIVLLFAGMLINSLEYFSRMRHTRP